MGTGNSGKLILKDSLKVGTQSGRKNGYREFREVDFKGSLKTQYPIRKKEWVPGIQGS